ncbi:helix-turn-helix domain-containing protein [Chryseobacterium indologenes]|uniref:helix-turn-helix domain-containing protein n=1 Tax=Chryseobacterium indologenes TaxID=253 RepID=UPI001624FBCF|nr:helix-turn-helix domain-containing protein [Chryseobacterium indologenes]
MTGNDIVAYRKGHNLTQQQFADMVGVSKNTISNYEGGGVIPKSKIPILEKIINNIPNIGSSDEFEIRNEVKPKFYPTHLEVKLVTSKARAGYADSYYAEEYLKDLPVVLVEADKEYKGNYLAFEVDGDSMEPEYFAGDIVICREVKRNLWQYKLHYKDYDFVIAHSSKGIMLKEIVDHDIETGNITCHSINNELGNHNDFILNLHEVQFLYNVVEHRRSGRAKRRNR